MGWVGVWVKLYSPMLFLICHFWVLQARTAKPEKHGFSLNAPKNVFQWWVCSFEVILPRGVKSSPFYPQTIFTGPIKAIILHGNE